MQKSEKPAIAKSNFFLEFELEFGLECEVPSVPELEVPIVVPMVPEFELEANGGLRPFRSWIQGGGSSLRAVNWRRSRWALISLDLQF